MSLHRMSPSVISLPITPNLAQLQKPDFCKLMSNIETIIMDIDGVLWIDDKPIPHSVDVVNKLKEKGIQIILYTNNSTRNSEEFLNKATNMGFLVDRNDIITTATLVVSYLKQYKFDKKIYLVGSRGLAEELELAGYRHLGIGPDVLEHSLVQTVENFQPDPNVGAVVVGYDAHFCYTKLLKAASYLNKPECHFLATTADECCLVNPDIVFPGTGPILKAIEAASQREAIVLGKPYSHALEALKIAKSIDPKKTMIIGDRTTTDIFFGNRSGFITVLVLSGATEESIFEKKRSCRRNLRDFVPDYYLDTLGELDRNLS
ncbi:uncharacterized protein LOC130442946 [Diorhabda sublineata]|uniref:uncharacterized protein LOC130442946 n=1 Tax=Diorhabda sublineata TaxID=1163346 RepID=UPI0024E0C61F|nr:uncharacterized protein LOC130442946 [Diorhabda sublineata]